LSMSVLGVLKRSAKRSPAAIRAVRALYPALIWLRNRRAYAERRAPYLATMEFSEVRFSNRGNEPTAHLRRTGRLAPIDGADLLILGVGRGEELPLWEAENPKSVTAVDLISRCDEWRRYEGVAFAQMDVRNLDFPDDSFDLVTSTAVLEHVDGVERAASEMARVVRPGGLVFANFGPLYNTYGGAHYLGAYEHLWMADSELRSYLERRGSDLERDEGLFYLQHGMFSRLTCAEYLSIFRQFFVVEYLIVHVSAPGLRYRRCHSKEWELLMSRFAERDLLTFALTVWMRPIAREQDGLLT
jgi:SAM-dependent methyltransferase